MSFKNVQAFKARLKKKVDVRGTKNAKQAVTRAVMLVEGAAKESIAAGGSGSSVIRYNPRRTHTTSKPLQAPATDTGFLISQITTTVMPLPNGSIVGQIISSAPYSKALEYGTTNMQPRPFMHPAFVKNKKKIKEIFVSEGIIK